MLLEIRVDFWKWLAGSEGKHIVALLSIAKLPSKKWYQFAFLPAIWEIGYFFRTVITEYVVKFFNFCKYDR